MINLQKNEKNKDKQMKKFTLNKLFLASVAMFAMSAVNVAHADFVVLDKDGGNSNSTAATTTMSTYNNTNNINSVSSNNIVQIGTPDDSINKPLKGFAKDLPLVTVLKQITPSGWVAKKEGSVDVNQSTSWEGGSNWVDTLSQLANNNNFSAIVNWNKKELKIVPKGTVSPSISNSNSNNNVSNVTTSNTHTFVSTTNTPIIQGGTNSTTTTTYETDKKVVSSASNAKPNNNNGSSVFELADNNGNFSAPIKQVVANNPTSITSPSNTLAPTTVNTVNGIKTTTTVISQPVVNGANQAIQQTWTLEKGKSLKENVMDWAKKAGWHVAWNGSDYPIDVPATFTGTFDDENGPIAALSNAYAQAEQPLIFDFKSANRTLVVSNYSYEQRFFKDKINVENSQ